MAAKVPFPAAFAAAHLEIDATTGAEPDANEEACCMDILVSFPVSV